MTYQEFTLNIIITLVAIGLALVVIRGLIALSNSFYDALYKYWIKWIGFLFKGRLVLLDRPLSEDNTETYQALSLKSFEAWKSIIIKAKK